MHVWCRRGYKPELGRKSRRTPCYSNISPIELDSWQKAALSNKRSLRWPHFSEVKPTISAFSFSEWQYGRFDRTYGPVLSVCRFNELCYKCSLAWDWFSRHRWTARVRADAPQRICEWHWELPGSGRLSLKAVKRVSIIDWWRIFAENGGFSGHGSYWRSEEPATSVRIASNLHQHEHAAYENVSV